MSKSNYAAAHDTVRFTAKRFAMSPFLEKYRTPDIIFGAYAQRFYALTVGNDPVKGYWALRRNAVLYDVPERPIEIEGRDALALFAKVFARPLDTLKVGRGRYAIACLPDGGVLMDGIMFRLSDERYWYVQADGEFTTWLSGHAGGLDVSVRDPRAWVLQIQGPKSLNILSDLTDGALGDDFGYFHSTWVKLAGQEVYVSRTGWTGEMGFEIYVPYETVDCPALWDHLLEVGKPHGLIFDALESMGIRRMEAGILDNGTDMDTAMTPFEAGLGPFIDMEMPGFIGREALLDADRSTLLVGLSCDTDVPFAGLEVFDGNKAVARMRAGGWSPYLDRGIGYVHFNEPGDWIGRELKLQTREGRQLPCRIVALPFYDAEKRIPRGLDRAIPQGCPEPGRSSR